MTAGSTVNDRSTRCVSQNLVQGTGAPTRGAAANNENLNQAAGVRLIGAGASLIQRSNIVDNSYGVFNAQLDGTTANTAVPVQAENNWWGLRANATDQPRSRRSRRRPTRRRRRTRSTARQVGGRHR